MLDVGVGVFCVNVGLMIRMLFINVNMVLDVNFVSVWFMNEFFGLGYDGK